MELITKEIQSENKSCTDQNLKMIDELKKESFGSWTESTEIKCYISVNQLEKECFGNWNELDD